jgi:hypothetical protein
MESTYQSRAGTSIATDSITVSHRNIIEIGRFHSQQASIDNFTCTSFNGPLPFPSAPNFIMGVSGPTASPISGVPFTIGTIQLRQGSWLLSFYISGTLSASNAGTEADLCQWKVLVPVVVTGVAVTPLATIQNDNVSNGTFTPGSVVSFADGGSLALQVQVNSTVSPANWSIFYEGVLSSPSP